MTDATGQFSYVMPSGWIKGDATRITYGSAVLLKDSPVPPTDTAILLGNLGSKLFASAEPDNTKAVIRLASDMGEFYMPFKGTRLNQKMVSLGSYGGVPGKAAYYEVKFDDATKPNGQIWAAVVGSGLQRWFVVWLGSSIHPIDQATATALAESIMPS